MEVAVLLEAAVEALGGSPRAGQQRMAQEVAEALETGRHLLVQAGTGTGKSLGYLVPAAFHAVSTDETVIVSTATLALQRQIMSRDLPLVAEAVTPLLPRAPRIALLKGWHNYVCLSKIDGGYPTEVKPEGLFDLDGDAAPSESKKGKTDSPFVEQVRRVHAWARETDSGDRDDLVPGVTDRAWRQVSVTAMECVGARCRFIKECFPDKAKTASREADVVVTNHAMLGIAASGSPAVLPEHGAIVVDEAHELADRVTSAATAELSGGIVEGASRLARRHAGADVKRVGAAAAELSLALAAAPEGLLSDGLSPELLQAVAATRDALRDLMTQIREAVAATSAPGKEPDGGAKMAQSAALALFEVAERMAVERSQSDDVLWVERPSDGPSRLMAAPLNVAGLIGCGLLGQATGVLTSATLTLGGSFDSLARAVGLPGEGSGSGWRGVDVGSPFDYPSQGILYIASHLPAPGREPVTEEQFDEIASLIEAAGGRTLGLFSSRRAATLAAEAMRERLDFPVLAQGDDVIPTLIRRFQDDDAACLFGTLSLWQGVDIPGGACRLVIIDRIPFPRPDDPVKSARSKAADESGGSGFMQVSAAHAALMLAQGSGRLIRTHDDKGVVAVLDPRLVTKRYGEFLARSLPDFWRTTDGDVARDALARLAVTP